MAGEIVHLEIPSRSFERSAAFYAKLFGWRADGAQSGGHLLFEIPGAAGTEAGGSPSGGTTGSLVRAALAQATGPLPFVSVDDIDKTLAEAERQGGRILVPRLSLAPGTQYGLLADVDGNVIAVVSRGAAGSPPKKGAKEAVVRDGVVAVKEAAKEAVKEATKKAPAPPARPAKQAAKPPSARKR
jgi:predicted enzyme related to lactoylglutathione lyase